MSDNPARAIAAGDEPIEGRNPFASRTYQRWWAATIVGATGIGIQTVTVPLFVRDRVSADHRAIAIAAALICQTLPGVLLVLVGGVVADRVERRRILVRTHAAAAVVSLSYLALSGFSVNAIWPVFLLAAVIGSAGAFTQPARQSMVPQMLSRSQLPNGVILGTVAFTASLQFGGPMVGGVVADAAGLAVAFGAEVVLLASGAFLFSRVATGRPIPTGRSIRADFVEGVRYARESRAILGLLFIAALPGVFFMAPMTVTVVLVVEDVLQASDRFVGILMGCFGGGVVAGSILMTWRPLPRRGLLLCAAPIWSGLIFVAYGLSSSLPLSMAILVLWGLGGSIFINLTVSLLQETASREVMGRVMSMYSLAFTASAPIGFLQAGVVASVWGPRATIISSGAAVAAIGLACVLFLRPVRRLS